MLWVASEESDVDLLYDYSDDVESYIEGTRDEWVAWLKQQILTNSPLALIFFEEEGKVKGYCVCSKAIMPPVTKSIFVLYAHSTLASVENIQIWGEICEWARGIGANKIEMKTKSPALFEKAYGFDQDEFTSLVLRL